MNAASLRRARTIRSGIMYLSLVLSTLTVYPVVLKLAGLGGAGLALKPSLENTSVVHNVCGAASSVVADCQGFESSSQEHLPLGNCTAQKVSSFMASEEGSVQVAGGLLLLHKMLIGLPGLFAQFFLYLAYIFFDLYTFHHEMKLLNQHVKVLEDRLESLEKSTNALVYKSMQRFYEVGGTSPAFAEAWSMHKVLP